MSDRIIKVDELIRQQLGEIISGEVEFPLGTLVTITKVSTSADLKNCKVFLTVMPLKKQHEAIKILIKEVRNLEKWLNRKITLRRIPKLKFVFDYNENKVTLINELLDNLN